jgi:hypothetical protein
MEDLTGLGKIAETELARTVYKDALSGAAQEGGKALTDLTKSFRLFMAPLQALAVVQDKLAGWFEEVRKSVPPERQTEAPASTTGPIIQRLIFEEEKSPVVDMFLGLLSRSIDTEKQHKHILHSFG